MILYNIEAELSIQKFIFYGIKVIEGVIYTM